METFTNKQATVINFIANDEKWDLQSLHNILPAYIIAKINTILIPTNNIDDKIAWI